MHARSALFDLYGDYLRPHGGRAPVAALVRLLAPLTVAAPAVRTAVSRMVRQGWLIPVRINDSPGYQLSVKAVHRLDEAAARIYRTTKLGWDGHLDLLILSLPENRARRARLHTTLAYLGYGSVGASTWVAPRAADELDSLLAEAGVAYERFRARHSGGDPGAAALIGRAWDLDALGDAYGRFVADLTPVVAAITRDSDDQAAFAARFQLVHAWRAFLFRDPQLPATLVGSHARPWPGKTAATFFDRHEALLRPAADRFVDRCLSPLKGTS